MNGVAFDPSEYVDAVGERGGGYKGQQQEKKHEKKETH
jgi:hypothetical protein